MAAGCIRRTAWPRMRRTVLAVAGVMGIGLFPVGCGLFEDPPAPTAETPPPLPRPARTAPRPRAGDTVRAEPEPAPAESPLLSGAVDQRPLEALAASPEPRSLTWRVAADRTIGCAVPEALRVLRGTEGLQEAQPRLAAQARREGGCLTTFRVSEWVLIRDEGDLVLLRLANPPPGVAPMELYFLRRDVVSALQPPAASG